jgi:hypothetical protein
LDALQTTEDPVVPENTLPPPPAVVLNTDSLIPDLSLNTAEGCLISPPVIPGAALLLILWLLLFGLGRLDDKDAPNPSSSTDDTGEAHNFFLVIHPIPAFIFVGEGLAGGETAGLLLIDAVAEARFVDENDSRPESGDSGLRW